MAPTLQKRVEALESQVAELRDQIHSGDRSKEKDWRRAIQRYAGDEDLQSVFAEAMKLREDERKRSRPRPRKSNGSQQ